MAAKEKTETHKLLIQKAKELGNIPNYWVLTEENLKKAVEERSMEAGTTEIADIDELEAVVDVEEFVDDGNRPEAPPDLVINRRVGGSRRGRFIDQCEKDDPAAKYLLLRASTTDQELAAKGIQRTGKTFGNDIVCRVSKTSYNESNRVKLEDSFRSIESMGSDNDPMTSVTENPKKVQ